MDTARIGRYWNKVERRGDSECWPWLAFCNPCGYGIFRAPPDQLAHRAGWRIAFGEIPDGLCVCHHCDNPPCQNPRHLFLGTPGDNSDDKVSKGRQGRVSRPGELSPSAKLSNGQVTEIRRSYEEGVTQDALAKRYNVSQSHISALVKARRWSHIGDPTKVDGRMRVVRGQAHPHATLTDEQVAEIRAAYVPRKVSQQSLADRYGISQQSVSFIVRGISRV